MGGDGSTATNFGFHGMQFQVHHLDWRASNDVRRQVRLREDHLHAEVDGQDAWELHRIANVGVAPHAVEVLPAHPDGGDVDGRNVI